MSGTGRNSNRRTFVIRLSLESEPGAVSATRPIRGQAECLELNRRERITGFEKLRRFIESSIEPAPQPPDQTEEKKA